jgi:hypothetical protein
MDDIMNVALGRIGKNILQLVLKEAGTYFGEIRGNIARR